MLHGREYDGIAANMRRSDKENGKKRFRVLDFCFLFFAAAQKKGEACTVSSTWGIPAYLRVALQR